MDTYFTEIEESLLKISIALILKHDSAYVEELCHFVYMPKLSDYYRYRNGLFSSKICMRSSQFPYISLGQCHNHYTQPVQQYCQIALVTDLITYHREFDDFKPLNHFFVLGHLITRCSL